MDSILVAIDFSKATDSVLAAATIIARKDPARLVLVHVYPEPSGLSSYAFACVDAIEDPEAQARQMLEAARLGLEVEGFEARARFVSGHPGPAIVKQAGDCGANLVVLGSCGHGPIRHLLLGSTTEYVLNHSGCPVVVVPACAPGTAVTMEPVHRAG